jgi:hypothetical protein
MGKLKNKKARFKVGDWVSFRYGTSDSFAQIIEVMGPIGVGGRYLYGIRMDTDHGPDTFGLPEDEMKPASPPDKAAIMKFLKEGGLVEILRANLGGGPDQPRAWLGYNSSGKIIPVFSAERGLIGGASVPFFALHEYSVFTGKQEEVINFLASFGLNRGEAQEVVVAVGTAP